MSGSTTLGSTPYSVIRRYCYHLVVPAIFGTRDSCLVIGAAGDSCLEKFKGFIVLIQQSALTLILPDPEALDAFPPRFEWVHLSKRLQLMPRGFCTRCLKRLMGWMFSDASTARDETTRHSSRRARALAFFVVAVGPTGGAPYSCLSC